MKINYILSVLVAILCLSLNVISSAQNNNSKIPIKFFNIKLIPSSGSFTPLSCVFWEYNINNAEKIEIFFRSGQKTILIYENKSVNLENINFNSWKDKGITHCPFNGKNINSRTAVYFYKVKIKKQNKLITRTFVINREEK